MNVSINCKLTIAQEYVNFIGREHYLPFLTELVVTIKGGTIFPYLAATSVIVTNAYCMIMIFSRFLGEVQASMTKHRPTTGY